MTLANTFAGDLKGCDINRILHRNQELLAAGTPIVLIFELEDAQLINTDGSELF